MARRLELGEAGEIRTDPQVQDADTGRWTVKAAGDKRRAGRYRARVYYRDQAGVVKEITRHAPKELDAKRLAREALAERTTTTTDSRVKRSTPFTQVGEHWLSRIARSDSGLSARSVSDYTGAWRRYVDAAGSPLRGLTLGQAADRQRLRAHLEHVAEAHGDGAAHTTRSVLSAIFRMAERDGVLTANPMTGLGQVKRQTPKASKRELRRALTREERAHLLAVADESASTEGQNPRSQRRRRAAADLLAVLAGTGARIAEGRSLRWESVDLATGVIRIDGTKSAAASRTVNAPPWLLARLVARAEEYGTEGYVVAAPSLLGSPETAWDQSNASSAIREVFDAAGLEWATAHTLRRTTASLAHGAGIPLARIAGQLGHAGIETTMRAYIGREHDADKSDIAAVL